MPSTDAHELVLECLTVGIEAARPAAAVDRNLNFSDADATGPILEVNGTSYPLDRYHEVLVVGGGKGSDELAVALAELLGDYLDGGVVITDTQTTATEMISILEGEHPTPGSGSVAGGRAVLDAAVGADEETLVIATVTGGASALLCAPIPGIDVSSVRGVTDALLSSGASIDELNTVRRAISRIKGGKLASTAAPATVVGLYISDVVGDDPAVIGSGPTVSSDTTAADALAVLDRYEVNAPDVITVLTDTVRQHAAGTDETADNFVIGSNRDALEAIVSHSRATGHNCRILSSTIEGEARVVGTVHAAIAREIAGAGAPVEPPAILLSGGETTVTVTGDGTGGPNLETALAAAIDFPTSAVFAAVDTDGHDGSTPAAGAIVDADTVDNPDAARDALAANDSYSYLYEQGTLLETGSTGTNVNDLRVLVVPKT
ncbi:MAG: glycerate kinase type-2 family protein [Natronomonas sp.]